MNIKENQNTCAPIIVTAGTKYLDIDAYACCVAMSELLNLKGKRVFAYSSAICNYSVCNSLLPGTQPVVPLPKDFDYNKAEYIIVDVSDPEYISKGVNLENVVAIYDHHTGFEEYWDERIGEGSHIEFVGAAATLIYREWEKAGLTDKMSHSTAQLLIAAILDNTLNMTSSNTTSEDIKVFNELCKRYGIGKKWCEDYFAQVQKNIELDIKNALFGDVKIVRDNPVLPTSVGQLAIWNTENLSSYFQQIQAWFNERFEDWLINFIDIKSNCSYFMCPDKEYQKKIEEVFSVSFKGNVAKTKKPYLRKEIIKITLQKEKE